jgi:tRNA(Ile)-lysidine synthase
MESVGRALPARFLQAWADLESPPSWRRLLVGVSGGTDSLALLHLLHEARVAHRLELVVGHADHGIHPASGAIARRVVEAANALSLSVVVGRLELGAGTSETRAREARHAWLAETRAVQGADAVVLAHHQDDQLETILLRVLAGSGPAGLAGMQPRQGGIVRPLLGFRKAELADYLAERGIEGWEDPANRDPAHERSWLRSVVLPMLRERSPEIGTRLLRLGHQAASGRAAWSAALDALPGLDLQQAPERISVAGLPLATYDSALATAVVQAVARRAGCVLGLRRAGRVIELLRRGQSGRTVELAAGWRAEVAFGRLAFYQARGALLPIRFTGTAGQVEWGGWRVSWTRGLAPAEQRRDGWVGWFIGEGAVLRGPEPGDRLAPLGGMGHRNVMRLLQDARIERSRRAAWPLVEIDGEVAWVAGVCRSRGRLPAGGDDALRIEVSGG